jgi:hypothetical protein
MQERVKYLMKSLRGFRISVDIDYYYDTNEIANYVKQKLISALSNIHLGQFINTAKNKHFHIHNKDFMIYAVLFLLK